MITLTLTVKQAEALWFAAGNILEVGSNGEIVGLYGGNWREAACARRAMRKLAIALNGRQGGRPKKSKLTMT